MVSQICSRAFFSYRSPLRLRSFKPRRPIRNDAHDDARYSGAIAEYSPMSEVRPHHHGMTPFSFENVPVGPFASRSARRTGSRAACWTVRVPWKLSRSVAVKPGDAALTLMRVDSKSKGKASVIALSAVFDGEYVAPNIERCGFVGSAFNVSEPEELDTLTICAADSPRRSRGWAAHG